ncbi:MAG: hypothetical protein ACLVCA_01660 [Peptoniphilus sp.]|uniref:hypothetical protein n=1 Tax=Peptoniphilus sp. TaxID=1971214 RepID=UPI003999C7EB
MKNYEIIKIYKVIKINEFIKIDEVIEIHKFIRIYEFSKLNNEEENFKYDIGYKIINQDLEIISICLIKMLKFDSSKD